MAPLLGPPEIHNLSTTTAKASLPTSLPPNSFMDMMNTQFNAPVGLPPMGYTENHSATLLSSGNPCLDLFFQIVPNTPAEILISLLQSSWKQDPPTALKLVCHLRGVRGTGKSDKEGFYTAALWLHKHHPNTLALNVRSIADFGYLKDLLEILYRLLYGADVRREERARRLTRMTARGGRRRRIDPIKKKESGNGKKAKQGTKEEMVAKEMERTRFKMEEDSRLRKKKRADVAIRLLDRYNNDRDYRFLHDKIADFFSDLLITDLKHLRSGDVTKISLGAKWCPSIDSSFDKSTLLCESIARRVFPKDSYEEYVNIEDKHYAYRVRDRLRKEVLVPLRKVLELPEVYISANQWNLLPYKRVASVAMKNYRKLFLKHDRERFTEYLKSVREGKTTIAAGALLPHEILLLMEHYNDVPFPFESEEVEEEEDDDDDDHHQVSNEVAELLWQRMVNDLKSKGKLKNCIAVCDVSGSMQGTPMHVSVALGLLASDLSEEPWKGSVITFSSNPQLHKIRGETLRKKASFVASMEWGHNTNLQAVFDKILRVAVEGNLAKEQMIRRVFVFSDMEFDQASENKWETDYMAIQRKFGEKGYGPVVPEIVFWNLRDTRSTPVPSSQKGVAMVSGFSKNLMTLFLEGEEALQPLNVMEKAIAGKEYENLVVYD